MGNCFSDPSKKGGQRLGSGPSSTPENAPQGGGGGSSGAGAAGGTRPGRAGSGSVGHSLGGHEGGPPADRRSAAAAAAERRQQEASNKGVNKNNPKAGQLSAKAEQRRKDKLGPEQTGERMMDPGQYN